MINITNSYSQCLDWNQRPKAVKDQIALAFSKLVGQSQSNWGMYNGDKKYSIATVNEHILMAKIIEQSPDKKDFYAIDIGAGNFQWVWGLAEFMETQDHLPQDIKVHIIGIRGEQYLGKPIVEKGRCVLYFFGSFQVENILTSFLEPGRELELENKVDLIVSRWCFRHLVDPVGTFAQTNNLLQPGTGWLVMDGFLFLNGEKDTIDAQINRRVTQLFFFFLDTKAPFLTKHYDNAASANHFILQKQNSEPCCLPMSYIGCETSQVIKQNIGSGYVTRYVREPQVSDHEELDLPKSTRMMQFGDKKFRVQCDELNGDRALFDWLKNNNVLTSSETIWKPLKKDKDT